MRSLDAKTKRELGETRKEEDGVRMFISPPPGGWLFGSTDNGADGFDGVQLQTRSISRRSRLFILI